MSEKCEGVAIRAAPALLSVALLAGCGPAVQTGPAVPLPVGLVAPANASEDLSPARPRWSMPRRPHHVVRRTPEQCRRLRDRGIPFAMLGSSAMESLLDGDHVVVEQERIRILQA
jgi:hypothetical protein